MFDDSECRTTREKLSAIKQLFLTRRLHQCIQSTDECLARARDEKAHDAGLLLYLHFYLALSHDTLAREAGMRNRQVHLDLAEQHYLAAICELGDGAENHEHEDMDADFQSPTSSTHSDTMHRCASAASLTSDHSSSTAASSLVEEEHEYSTHHHPTLKNPDSLPTTPRTPFQAHQRQRQLSPLNTCSPPPSHALSTSLSAFKTRLETHLAGVRELRDAPAPCQAYSFARSWSATPVSRPGSRGSEHDGAGREGEREREVVLWQRRRVGMSFRPRFDPAGVRRLCAEALGEL